MKIIVDMNLSPKVAEGLRQAGFDCNRWSEFGRANDNDVEIVDWALQNRAVIISCDRDFGEILAMRRLKQPSVIQIRRRDVYAEAIVPILIWVLQEHKENTENRNYLSASKKLASCVKSDGSGLKTHLDSDRIVR